MTWKPDVMIYHSPCDDGFGAAWAAWMRWRGEVEYLPGTYGKPAPDVAGKRVLIGDFSFKRDMLVAMADSSDGIVILDHHKTAEADLANYRRFADQPERFTTATVASMSDDLRRGGYPDISASFDMERSGARMVWDFCHPGVDAPLLIRLIEDRDLWRFAIPETKAFSLWLRSHPYDFEEWEMIAQELEEARGNVRIMTEAAAMQRFYDQKVREMLRETRTIFIGGHVVPAVNCSWAFASDVAHEVLAANPDAPFAACHYDRGDGRRSYSLRSEDHRLDVSEIAKANGGGGHRNAAGFEVAIP